MKKGILPILAIPFLLPLGGCSSSTYSFVEADSSKGSVGYEIFVGSFRDSDGDGIGDFKGIEESLPYLEDLGIRRIWLTPIMPSHSYHKYDVDDYFAVDPSFGTLEDFSSLVDACHEAGIDIIIDLVLNHTSRNNQWFKDSAAARYAGEGGDGGAADDYMWVDRVPSGEDDVYYYYSQAASYYLGAFSPDMPELNLDSPRIRKNIEDIVSFWLEGQGIDGFRLDATTYYYEDDVEENVSFLTWFRQTCEKVKEDVYIVGEAWGPDQATLARYASSKIHFFNFPTACEAANLGTSSYIGALKNSQTWLSFDRSLATAASLFEEEAGGGGYLAPFISNHDMDRWGSYFNGVEGKSGLEKLAAAMMILSPGTPWMYYGEEILMNGLRGQDSSSDALRRQGMVWGDGIEKCKTPENRADTNGETVGALEAQKDPQSLYQHYKRAINLRNAHNDLFEFGSFAQRNLNQADMASWMAFDISYGGKNYLLVHHKAGDEGRLSLEGNYSVVDGLAADGASASYEGGRLTAGAYASVLLEEGQ